MNSNLSICTFLSCFGYHLRAFYNPVLQRLSYFLTVFLWVLHLYLLSILSLFLYGMSSMDQISLFENLLCSSTICWKKLIISSISFLNCLSTSVKNQLSIYLNLFLGSQFYFIALLHYLNATSAVLIIVALR